MLEIRKTSHSFYLLNIETDELTFPESRMKAKRKARNNPNVFFEMIEPIYGARCPFCGKEIVALNKKAVRVKMKEHKISCGEK